MNYFEILPSIVTITNFVGFLPQIKQTYLTKSVEDLSLPMYAIFAFNVICMTIYAVHLTLSNSTWMFLVQCVINLILTLSMLLMIIKYKKW